MYPARRLLVVTVALFVVAGCAQLEQVFDTSKPTASVEDMRLANVNFERAELVFDVVIDNPNPVGVDLAGFDYALSLEGSEVLSGRRDRAVSLPADGTETIEVPLTVPFAEVESLVGDLAGRERVDYGLELGLDVDVPGAGVQRLGTTTSGSLPVPQRPGIELQRARVDSLSLSGARLVLELVVDNPNAFGIDLDRIGYALAIDGQRWASGKQETGVSLPANGQGGLELPVSVRFGAIGRGAYDLLSGGGQADYTLEADLAGRAGLAGFGAFELPLERSGRVEIAR